MQAILDGLAIDEIVPLVLQSGTGVYSNTSSGEDSAESVPRVESRPAAVVPPVAGASSVQIPTVKTRLAETAPVATGAGSAAPAGPPKQALLEDVKFHPNIVNTVVFLVSVTMQACTVSRARWAAALESAGQASILLCHPSQFLINYEGAPFMEPLTFRSGITIVALGTYAISIVGALGLSRELTSWLQLIVLPTFAMRVTLAGVIVLNGAACVALERLVRWVADKED